MLVVSNAYLPSTEKSLIYQNKMDLITSTTFSQTKKPLKCTKKTKKVVFIGDVLYLLTKRLARTEKQQLGKETLDKYVIDEQDKR
jgi:hypothetical protein